MTQGPDPMCLQSGTDEQFCERMEIWNKAQQEQTERWNQQLERMKKAMHEGQRSITLLTSAIDKYREEGLSDAEILMCCAHTIINTSEEACSDNCGCDQCRGDFVVDLDEP
jgi:hypothetical protein